MISFSVLFRIATHFDKVQYDGTARLGSHTLCSTIRWVSSHDDQLRKLLKQRYLLKDDSLGKLLPIQTFLRQPLARKDLSLL